MPIYYDDQAGALAIGSEYCEDCHGPLYDTGCDATGCRGYRCDNCGTGCDSGFPGSHCDAALEAESDDDHEARVNAERTAFGLPATAPTTAEE